LVEIELLVSVSSAIFAGLGLIYSGLGHRADARSSYVETFNKIAEGLEQIETSQERNENYLLFGSRWLYLLDRIGSMALNGAIPYDLARYFDQHFKGARAMLKEDPFSSSEKDLSYIVEWCDSNDLQPDKRYIPKPGGSTEEQSEGVYVMSALDER
jgi:hypothetical protein